MLTKKELVKKLEMFDDNARCFPSCDLDGIVVGQNGFIYMSPADFDESDIEPDFIENNLSGCVKNVKPTEIIVYGKNTVTGNLSDLKGVFDYIERNSNV